MVAVKQTTMSRIVPSTTRKDFLINSNVVVAPREIIIEIYKLSKINK